MECKLKKNSIGEVCDKAEGWTRGRQQNESKSKIKESRSTIHKIIHLDELHICLGQRTQLCPSCRCNLKDRKHEHPTRPTACSSPGTDGGRCGDGALFGPSKLLFGVPARFRPLSRVVKTAGTGDGYVSIYRQKSCPYPDVDQCFGFQARPAP